MARKGVEPAGLKRYRLAKKRKTAPRRKVTNMARRRYVRRASGGRRFRSRRKTAKPSLLTAVALAYKGYTAVKAAQAAGSEPMNTFFTEFTGIKFGRYAANGQYEWDTEFFLGKQMPLIVGVGGSYALNKIPQTKGLVTKIPMIGRKFKW